jgi:hypothetical protein
MKLWFTAPKGVTPAIYTSATDYRMTVQRDYEIGITLRRLLMSTFLIRSNTCQTSSYPIVLTRLGGPRSRPNQYLNL